MGLFTLVQGHDQHDAGHNDGEGAIEPDPVQVCTDHGASYRAGQGAGRQRQAQLELGVAAAKEGSSGGDILGQNGNAVGTIGDRARNAHKYHDRYGYQRATAGHDIEEACDYARRGEQGELPKFQHKLICYGLERGCILAAPAAMVIPVCAERQARLLSPPGRRTLGGPMRFRDILTVFERKLLFRILRKRLHYMELEA